MPSRNPLVRFQRGFARFDSARGGYRDLLSLRCSGGRFS
jgi:hypothetical protein